MTYRFANFSCLCVFVFLLFAGCGGDKLPPGIPKLYPATLTVIQDGKPLAGAEIIMINVDPAINWSAGGVTDQNGVLKLRTQGRYNGAPAGRYKVAVEKTEIPDIVRPEEPSNSEEMTEYNRIIREIRENTFHVVDQKFGMEKTKLEVEISPSNLKVTVDVSPAVHVKVTPAPRG